MERFAYRAYIKKDCKSKIVALIKEYRESVKKFVDRGLLYTASVFRLDRDLFFYYECADKIIMPSEILVEIEPYLEEWPGEPQNRHWIRMMDIYHSLDAEMLKNFRSIEPIKRTTVRVGRFKPEMLSSYIFYHYQYQEEKPGDFSKWCAIYLHENMAIIYGEAPDCAVPMPENKKLYTNNTPGNWGEVMYPHFQLWEGTHEDEKLWKKSETIWFI